MSTPGPIDLTSSLLKTLTDSIPNLNDSNFSLWQSKILNIFSLKCISHWLTSSEPNKCLANINLEIVGYILVKLDN